MPWVNDANAALATDLYQLTMLEAYVREGMDEPAVFDLFVRRLPEQRNYLVFAGLDAALHYLETLRFTDDALGYLDGLGRFSNVLLDYLADFRFSGDVRAVPEGTPVFATTPLLEVTAPIAEAQLVETFLLNQITFPTGAASKASRVVTAAAGRAVVDFGMRRMHGADAAIKGARAFAVAGLGTTSNVLAGALYGLSVTGTMAHSYIEAHASEFEAFERFVDIHPRTVLLVDTYDTLAGVRNVVRLAERLGEAFRVQAIRLDSGDLGALARDARAILDEAGLVDVEIIASGSLDEWRIQALVVKGAPIDGFGVGTRMGTLADAPYLDSVYKLSAYGDTDRMKLAENKTTLPGRKQVFRTFENGRAAYDTITRAEEEGPGEPLLRPVMADGRRLPEAVPADLAAVAAYAARERARLPGRLLALDPADPPYDVRVSSALAAHRDALRERLARQHGVEG